MHILYLLVSAPAQTCLLNLDQTCTHHYHSHSPRIRCVPLSITASYPAHLLAHQILQFPGRYSDAHASCCGEAGAPCPNTVSADADCGCVARKVVALLVTARAGHDRKLAPGSPSSSSSSSSSSFVHRDGFVRMRKVYHGNGREAAHLEPNYYFRE